MTTTQVLVTLGGAALIPLIFWYFFWSARDAVRAVPSGSGVQQIRVQVRGGYEPDVLVLEAGRPVRIDFYRAETAECSEEVVLGDFGIRRALAAFRTSSVEFVPERPGEYVFTCGMGMMRGKIVVEASPDGSGGERT